ncbi:DJ-1/PfpI family protein [Hahella sp. HN01]|uniref:DJ-1/PfpI family protein n=1 Tax=unclassified Hahella TaxID=2624107 RepID=UPI001C1EA03E|nr:DJ-1/PfpI family protein [Hahella sp. HN01]MBU6951038.1 DJ-1/PfpI family protein [Hahella sp. HN01]
MFLRSTTLLLAALTLSASLFSSASSVEIPQVTVQTPPVTGDYKGKIGVLVEEHFDETELVAFQQYFPAHGYEVVFMSYLWGQSELTFNGNDHQRQVVVKTDITQADLSQYAGVILIGGYAMDRLRYQTELSEDGVSHAPAVEFLRQIIATDRIKIGAICHSLWLFTADPALLQGRKVTAAHNIVADVRNAGGILQVENNQAVDTFVDGNLITGKHPAVVDAFMEIFLRELDKS